MTGWGVFRRRQTPPLLPKSQDYKPYLRMDFLRRCAYCRVKEYPEDNQFHFGVDHFRPKSRNDFAHLDRVYSNLYYSCNRCNQVKGNHWPSPALELRGLLFADPCGDDIYRDHLRLGRAGDLQPLSNCGAYTREILRLNAAYLVRWRGKMMALFEDVVRAQFMAEEVGKSPLPERDALLQARLAHLREICSRLKEYYL